MKALYLKAVSDAWYHRFFDDTLAAVKVRIQMEPDKRWTPGDLGDLFADFIAKQYPDLGEEH